MIRITYPLNTTNGRVAGFEFKNTRERIYTMHTTKGTKTFLSFSLSNVRFASLIVQSIAELLIPRSSVRYEFVYSAPLESNYFDSLNRRWIQSDTVPISSYQTRRLIRHELRHCLFLRVDRRRLPVAFPPSCFNVGGIEASIRTVHDPEGSGIIGG